ncbi:MAG TPA: DUF4175 family protein [Candidatus Ozemobacteraceae bacterium]
MPTPNRPDELLAAYPENSVRLEGLLGLYRRKRQTRVFLACTGWSMASFLGILLVFLLVERTPIQSEGMRWLCVIAAWGLSMFWMMQAVRALLAPPSGVEMAVEIEEIAPERFRSLIASAAEFVDPDAGHGTSSALRRLTVSTAAQTLTGEDVGTALKRFSRRKAAGALAAVTLLLIVWTGLSPAEVRRGVLRLIHPFAALPSWSSLELNVYPGSRIIARGDSLEISVVPNQPTELAPVLTLFKPKAPSGTATEMYPDETASHARYVYTLTGLQESTDYQVSVGQVKSDRFSITVMPRPELSGLRLTLHHPDYLATQPETLSEGVGDASVIAGSRIDIRGRASQTLKSAVLGLTPGGSLTAELSQGDTFIASLTVATDTRWSILLTNEFGLANDNPVRYRIRALQDASPTVTILKPAADIEFPTSKRLDMKVEATDDFGVVTTVLWYAVGNRSDWIPLNLKADFSPKKRFEVEYPWMLDTLAIEPGTKVSYYVKAEDAVKPAPNIATSPVYHLNMPSMYDVYKGGEQAHEDVTSQLQELMEAQKLRRQALEQTYEQIKHEGRMDEATERRLRELIQEGEQRQKQAEEIINKFQEMQERSKENPFSSPDALEKMQKVNELLNDVLDDESKRLMKQLRESLTNMKLDPRDLEKFEEAFKMDKYLKNLDRTIELLKQLKDERKLEALGQAVDDLLKRQQRMASETAALEEKQKSGALSPEEESKLNDLAAQQEKLRQELEQLRKQAEEIAEKKPQPGEPENPAAEDVKNLRDKMKQEDFNKTAEEIKKSLEQKNPSAAREPQQKMLKFLESLAKDGQKICTTCSGGEQKQLDLSRFIRRALNVSRDQETLLLQLNGLPGQFMRGQKPAIEGIIDETSVLQLLVRQQATDLEGALETLIRSSFTVDPGVLQPLQGVQNMFVEIVKNLEDRQIGRARNDQREIIRRFNLLAMELMRAQDQSQNQQNNQNAASAMQRFKDLTRRQLSLYQQMMQKQRLPADQRMMEDLRRMAMEQRKIRESLEQLMREGKQQMQTLGRLDDVMKEMQDLETKTLDPRLRREVAERQKALYDRMLKAQKSIKNREEESEERKATKAREIVQTAPDKPLPEIGTDTRDLARDFLGESREEYPKNYEILLREYYKSLSLSGENL